MNVLMVSSECEPFAKSGGLADVVSSLSRKLGEAGHTIKILIPGYPFIPEEEKTAYKKAAISLGFGKERVVFSMTQLSESTVELYFLVHPLFSLREGMYGNRNTGTYRDNHRRFTLLNRGAFALCRLLDWIPDIIHSHDWQASLIPAYLKSGAEGKRFRGVRSVLTIHNIGYQGIFSKHDIHVTGLDWERTSSKEASYIDHLNFLRTGILNSDRITTVSPRYAREIQSPAFGEGMEDLLTEKKGILSGILNGADYSEWNPQHDPYLPIHYSAENLLPKARIKTMLQRECGLPLEAGTPLIGMVSRLVSQKGFDELCDRGEGALAKICRDLEVQIVILGSGEPWIEESLEALAAHHPSLKVFTVFDNTLAHLIEAGSDFFLMPSRYEPCGLNQIYSLKYGTIPIVRETGGLADTVTDCTAREEEGTGFLIREQTPDAIFTTVQRAVEQWYRNRNSIDTLRRRGMKKDFSWDASARKYENLYHELTESGDPSQSASV